LCDQLGTAWVDRLDVLGSDRQVRRMNAPSETTTSGDVITKQGCCDTAFRIIAVRCEALECRQSLPVPTPTRPDNLGRHHESFSHIVGVACPRHAPANGRSKLPGTT
jgi:hypothetical protein